MNATHVLSQNLLRAEKTAGCPMFAAGLSGLATLVLVAPCVVDPALLALPALGFVALMRHGWRHERGG